MNRHNKLAIDYHNIFNSCFIIIILLVSVNTTAKSNNYQINARQSKSSSSSENRHLFNKTTTILLISFTAPPPNVPSIISPDGTIIETKPPKTSGTWPDTLGHKHVHEIKSLSLKKAQRLQEIIYKEHCPTTISSGACYDPRNAIIFIGADGNIVAELEICFACSNYELHVINSVEITMCEKKYNAIRKIFNDAGITYGINSRY